MFQWLKTTYHKFGSPVHFYRLSTKILPWLWGSAILLMGTGIVLGLGFSPPDYQQGNSFRAIFLHVPAAAVSMNAYVGMAIAGAIALIWRMKVAEVAVKAIAPVGASFAALALITGAIWGKPTWGTYWVWDARLTTTLIMFFLYVGVIALNDAIQETTTAARASAMLAIVGVVNIPLIKYSVNWWNTLHQTSTFKLTEKPSMPSEMWIPLLLTFLGTYCFFAAITFVRMQTEILRREQKSRWVKQLVAAKESS